MEGSELDKVEVPDIRKAGDPELARSKESAHVYGESNTVCATEKRSDGADFDPRDLMIDVGSGLALLWAENTTLRWCIDKSSLRLFPDRTEGEKYTVTLMNDAIRQWGVASPVKFQQVFESDVWDFRVRYASAPDCDSNGCVLASAYFPDAGQHDLVIYPTLIESKNHNYNVNVMVHELGHIFGLRHYFAASREAWRASAVFGKHEEVSIMNYGTKSVLTSTDLSDLKTLYELCRSGKMRDIAGYPVVFVHPFSTHIAAARMSADQGGSSMGGVHSFRESDGSDVMTLGSIKTNF